MKKGGKKLNNNIVYCNAECGYTKCKRNKKYAGPEASYVSCDQLIGCHVKLYVKESTQFEHHRYNNGVFEVPELTRK